MRAYIADLAAYNEGTLTGEWIDLDGKDADDIQGEITALLTKWGKEEYAVHDWEGPKALTSMGEYPDWEAVAAFVSAFEKHGEAFAIWADHDDAGDVERFEECYQGIFADLAEYAGRCLDDGLLGDAPPKDSIFYRYFDYESYGRDCELGGDIWTKRGKDGLHVFSNH